MKFNLSQTNHKNECKNCSLDFADQKEGSISKMSEKHKSKLEIICAWCKKHLGHKEDFKENSGSEKSITHGICEECSDKLQEKIKKLGK